MPMKALQNLLKNQQTLRFEVAALVHADYRLDGRETLMRLGSLEGDIGGPLKVQGGFGVTIILSQATLIVTLKGTPFPTKNQTVAHTIILPQLKRLYGNFRK